MWQYDNILHKTEITTIFFSVANGGDLQPVSGPATHFLLSPKECEWSLNDRTGDRLLSPLKN